MKTYMQKMKPWGAALALWVAAGLMAAGCSTDKVLVGPPEEPHETPPPGETMPPEEEEEEPPPPAPEGWLYGRLMDATTGRPVEGATVATVSAGNAHTSTEGGVFFLPLPAEETLLLRINAPGYAPTSQHVRVKEGLASFAEFFLLPFISPETFLAQEEIVMQRDGAKVVFPAGVLDTQALEVTVSLAWLDAENPNHLAAFPGGFRTNQGEVLESFGAIALEVREAETGKLLNLKAGAEHFAEVTVVASPHTPGETPLWVYDEEAGLWSQEPGEGFACEGVGTERRCKAKLPHLSWWNIDLPIPLTCLKACAVDADNRPVAGVYLEARGVEYRSASAQLSGADGCACLQVRPGLELDLTATLLGGISETKRLTPQGEAPSCSPGCLNEVSLRLSPPRFQALLSWGATPADLDAHLIGPCSDASSPACTEGRFHVYYGRLGALSEAPFAALLEDVRSGFGAEILSLSACAEGSYRYSVFSDNAPLLASSQAKVIILLPGGELKTYSIPSSNPGGHPQWVVGELSCLGPSCQCTWNPINAFMPKDLVFVAKPPPA